MIVHKIYLPLCLNLVTVKASQSTHKTWGNSQRDYTFMDWFQKVENQSNEKIHEQTLMGRKKTSFWDQPRLQYLSAPLIQAQHLYVPRGSFSISEINHSFLQLNALCVLVFFNRKKLFYFGSFFSLNSFNLKFLCPHRVH